MNYNIFTSLRLANISFKYSLVSKPSISNSNLTIKVNSHIKYWHEPLMSEPLISTSDLVISTNASVDI